MDRDRARHYPQEAWAPPVVPCWSFPPARVETRRRSCGGLRVWVVWMITFTFLLVFAALGLGALQIHRMQAEMEKMTQEKPAIQNIAPQKQTGSNVRTMADQLKAQQKPAAHLIGRADQSSSSGSLLWESRHGEAFTDSIIYRDGALHINQSGLYFIYSRVEYLTKSCDHVDLHTHSVSRHRDGHSRSIMEDHQQSFCLDHKRQAWTGASHLASLQHLHQADRLFVNVSHPKHLSKNYQGNYFGLFKV